MSKKRFLQQYLSEQSNFDSDENKINLIKKKIIYIDSDEDDNIKNDNYERTAEYWKSNLKDSPVYKINFNADKNEKSYKNINWLCERTNQEGTCNIDFIENGIRISYDHNGKKIYDKYDIQELSNGDYYGRSIRNTLFGKFIWHIQIIHNNDYLRGRYLILIEKKMFNIKKKIGRPKKKKPKINDDDYLKKIIGYTTKRKRSPRNIMNIDEWKPDSDPSHSVF